MPSLNTVLKRRRLNTQVHAKRHHYAFSATVNVQRIKQNMRFVWIIKLHDVCAFRISERIYRPFSFIQIKIQVKTCRSLWHHCESASRCIWHHEDRAQTRAQCACLQLDPPHLSRAVELTQDTKTTFLSAYLVAQRRLEPRPCFMHFSKVFICVVVWSRDALLKHVSDSMCMNK